MPLFEQQIDLLKDFFPNKNVNTFHAALSMDSKIEIASMILTSKNEKTIKTLKKKTNQINLYQKIEDLIFDCENIFLYLGFIDSIKLSLVNKRYSKKHTDIITKLDPNKQIENIFIKLVTEQNKQISEDNKEKELKLQKQITDKLIKTFNGKKIDKFPKDFSNLLRLYYKYILSSDYLAHEFIFESFFGEKNPDRIILLHNYLGMGWFKTIGSFYKLKQSNRYFLCQMGGSNGWDRVDNHKKFKNFTTESVELLTLGDAFDKLIKN